MKNKKPLSHWELECFPIHRDKAFEASEESIDRHYVHLKMKANGMCNLLLQEHPGILAAIERVAEDGLMEIASAVDPGDNSHGYYRFHLIMNLEEYRGRKTSNFIYLWILHVPQADNGYAWDDSEFDKRDTSNFSLRTKFLEHLALLGNKDTALEELHRLSFRNYSTCTEEMREGAFAVA